MGRKFNSAKLVAIFETLWKTNINEKWLRENFGKHLP